MSLPIISSQYFTDQPPCSKPPSRSSSGPPGPCITPSRVRKVPTTSLLMGFSSSYSPCCWARDRIAALNLKCGPRMGGSDVQGHRRPFTKGSILRLVVRHPTRDGRVESEPTSVPPAGAFTWTVGGLFAELPFCKRLVACEEFIYSECHTLHRNRGSSK